MSNETREKAIEALCMLSNGVPIGGGSFAGQTNADYALDAITAHILSALRAPPPTGEQVDPEARSPEHTELLEVAQMVCDHEGDFATPDGCVEALRAIVRQQTSGTVGSRAPNRCESTDLAGQTDTVSARTTAHASAPQRVPADCGIDLDPGTSARVGIGTVTRTESTPQTTEENATETPPCARDKPGETGLPPNSDPEPEKNGDGVGVARRVITPSFSVATGDSAPEGPNVYLAEGCKQLAAGLRFDATALPIDDLSFVAKSYGVTLIVDIRVPDRDKPGVEWIHVWRTLTCPWGPISSNGPDYIVRWMRETIANTLAHEVDESVTLDGERVFNPHRPLRADPPPAPAAPESERLDAARANHAKAWPKRAEAMGAVMTLGDESPAAPADEAQFGVWCLTGAVGWYDEPPRTRADAEARAEFLNTHPLSEGKGWRYEARPLPAPTASAAKAGTRCKRCYDDRVVCPHCLTNNIDTHQHCPPGERVPCPACSSPQSAPERESEPWFDTCQTLDCQAWPTWRVVDANGKVVRGSYNCDEHRPKEAPRVAGERHEHRPKDAPEREAGAPIEELIAASSLGTPEAVAIREAADPALVQRVLDRVDELERGRTCACGHHILQHAGQQIAGACLVPGCDCRGRWIAPQAPPSQAQGADYALNACTKDAPCAHCPKCNPDDPRSWRMVSPSQAEGTGELDWSAAPDVYIAQDKYGLSGSWYITDANWNPPGGLDARLIRFVPASRLSALEAEARELREKRSADDETWLRRMSNLLDTVENPGSLPEGAPGSLHRRVWEYGRSFKALATLSAGKIDSLTAELAEARLTSEQHKSSWLKSELAAREAEKTVGELREKLAEMHRRAQASEGADERMVRVYAGCQREIAKAYAGKRQTIRSLRNHVRALAETLVAAGVPDHVDGQPHPRYRTRALDTLVQRLIGERATLRAQLAEERARAEESARANEKAELARIASVLDGVERPAPIPEGAPGSLMRRAWDLGRNAANAIRRAEAAEARAEAIATERARLQSAGEDLQAACDVLREELQWYADGCPTGSDPEDGAPTGYNYDHGKRAKRALDLAAKVDASPPAAADADGHLTPEQSAAEQEHLADTFGARRND